MRDAKRSKVYAAERRALHKGYVNDDGVTLAPFESLDSVRMLVERIRNNSAIKRRYGKWLDFPIWVERSRNVSWSWGGPNGIKIAGIHMSKGYEWVVLHEVAHVIQHRMIRDHRTMAGHGWEFCSIFIDIVRFICGKEHSDRLKREFRKEGVSYKQKPNRAPLSDEQKQILRERLAVARQIQKENKHANIEP